MIESSLHDINFLRSFSNTYILCALMSKFYVSKSAENGNRIAHKLVKRSASTMKQKDDSIVKIAVQFEHRAPQLIEFDQKQPLTTIIQDLCSRWKLPQPDQFALQFCERNCQNYITEENRNEIKNGHVINLTYSSSKAVRDVLSALKSDSIKDQKLKLEKLSSLSADPTFAREFINEHGLAFIITIIEQRKLNDAMLSYCLQSFVHLMSHKIVSWHILEMPFIVTIASYVNDCSKIVHVKVIQLALVILESIVSNNETICSQIEKEIILPNLVGHLDSSNLVVQQNAILLINALFLRANASKRSKIASALRPKQNGTPIASIIATSADQMGAEMAHQLYVLQTLCLELLVQRMNTKMDPQDQDSIDKIKELINIAFEIEKSTSDAIDQQQMNVVPENFKKLGFQINVNLTLNFNETPPGMLALDCMYYFAKNHAEAYAKVVLENSSTMDKYRCPFGRTSLELVKLLCHILRLGEPPDEQNNTYYPMFFTHDRPFEEFYCICIILLNKTWKEMRATAEDFTKVIDIVREQIVRALAAQPLNFEKLKEKLQTLTYSEITSLRLKERIRREQEESHAKPIAQLKEQITPEIMDLIKKQRLSYLVEGTRFMKYSNQNQKEKNKFRFLRLCPNHKSFHYDDCDEKSTPSIEKLHNKFQVSDIVALVTGKDCPHMKGCQKSTPSHLAFSITFDGAAVDSLNFIAPNELVFDYWTDGVNVLLGNQMTSKEANNDLETLLSMEIKLRLLDAENIDIPSNAPEIPPDPPNYDFAL